MPTEIFKVNGVTVANIKSDSGIALFGIAVLAGSNYETPEIAGISHFSEHLFFKGTAKRNWRQINEQFAKLGVNNNAYTDNSEVFYHTTCPKENISGVIELMLDMFFNSTMPQEEIEKERGVIAEEKKMYEDDPKSAFSDELGKAFFVWHLGHEIIGTFDTIKSISREQIAGYLRDKTSLENMVFICSGDVDSEDLKKYIGDNMPSEHHYLRSSAANVCGGGMWTDIVKYEEKVKLVVERDNITQSTVQMVIDGLPSNDPLFHHAQVISGSIGGGMFSRLFARIRQELGLCYAVGMYTYPLSYPDRRIMSVYGYTSPGNNDQFIEECEKVLRETVKSGLDEDIFECAKTDYLAAVLRRTETSEGKAMYLVKKLLVTRGGSVEDVLDRIRAVTIKGCNDLIPRLLDVQYNWAMMVPKK
jgi:predicted Zn-dependent peptidase